MQLVGRDQSRRHSGVVSCLCFKVKSKNRSASNEDWHRWRGDARGGVIFQNGKHLLVHFPTKQSNLSSSAEKVNAYLKHTKCSLFMCKTGPLGSSSKQVLLSMIVSQCDMGYISECKTVLEAPEWLRRLSICIQLKSWSQGTETESHIRLPVLRGVCFSLYPAPPIMTSLSNK